jgi:hypothetical protein
MCSLTNETRQDELQESTIAEEKGKNFARNSIYGKIGKVRHKRQWSSDLRTQCSVSFRLCPGRWQIHVLGLFCGCGTQQTGTFVDLLPTTARLSLCHEYVRRWVPHTLQALP